VRIAAKEPAAFPTSCVVDLKFPIREHAVVLLVNETMKEAERRPTFQRFPSIRNGRAAAGFFIDDLAIQ